MISPIEANGMVSRTQDFSQIRQNEENRNIINQNHYHDTFEREKDQNLKTVRDADYDNQTDTRHDASQKGRNEYLNNGKKGKKKKPEDGKVTLKQPGGFDVKI
ncbi:MAG: hypothetical protein GX567_03555 [Clostridia bacterium]|nr:hypothetical protein [Clostridia bacterium]